MKSEKGFATVLLMTLLPVLLAFGAAGFFMHSLLKQDLGTLNVCRAAELKTHDKVGKVLAKLFRLNPKAKKLRKQYLKAQKDLAIAIASANAPAIAAAELKLLLIFAERELLALRQQGLIASANSQLMAGGLSNSSGIRSEWQSHQRPMSRWLRSSITMKSPEVPKLAVRPDLPDMAPAYETVSNFEQAQTWTQSWTVKYEVAGGLKSFLKFGGSFERSCSTSLYQKEEKWIAKLNAGANSKGKSLLRGWF